MSRKSWEEKIAPAVRRALEDGNPHFEVLCDGHGTVSLMTVDVTGDNTLVYMKRAAAEKLIAKLRAAVDALPKRKARRKP